MKLLLRTFIKVLLNPKKGTLQTKFMTSYQGQWYAHTSTEVWTNYPIAKEPASYYGKGTYTKF